MFRIRTALALLGSGIALLSLSVALFAVRPVPPGKPVADDLPAVLHLQWMRELPPSSVAWADQVLMQFDAAAEPVAAGNLVLVNSTRTDGVTAYDAATGEPRWEYTTDGPVRFAPAVDGERVFIASDDGYLHCVNLKDGKPRKAFNKGMPFRGGASDRKILGNERLISTWPVRGAPVVADNVVYFAAGIWPFMGVFLHALDAETGKVIWTNDGDGSTFRKQPHNTDAFAGVAPQGRLVVIGERLLVPGGRSVPACYDRRTGQQLHFRLHENSKKGGGSSASATENVYINGSGVFDLTNGDYLSSAGEKPLLDGNILYSCSRSEVAAFRLPETKAPPTSADLDDYLPLKKNWQPVRVGSVSVPRAEAVTKVGNRLYVGAANEVVAVDLPLEEGKSKVAWKAPIEGRPYYLAGGNGRLYVSTREGRLYCFGGDQVEPRQHRLPSPQTDDAKAGKNDLVAQTGVKDGYCLVWGAGNERLISELVEQTNLRLIVLEADREKAQTLRTRMWARNQYGERVSVIVTEGKTPELPPYFASLLVAEQLPFEPKPGEEEWLRKAFAALRPFGGVACLAVSEKDRPIVAETVRSRTFEGAKVREANGWMLVSREGPLPGSANWTHEHADASNTRVSRDQLVKAPLGLLWFGGPSNEGILPRHGHGPQPQVIDGRLLIEGVDMMRCLDIYTGRLLWETSLPGVGKPYNNLSHQPGANSSGSNFVSTPDGIYIAVGNKCVRLDPATGKRLKEFKLPKLTGEKDSPQWSFITVSGDYLVGGSNPTDGDNPKVPLSVKHLTLMDRNTGKVLWTAAARFGFRNNSICIGGDRCYAIDGFWPDPNAKKKLAADPTKPSQLSVFDLATGNSVWTATKDVFGTWLSYSAKHDVVVEAGRVARDTLKDEPKGMRAYRASDGKVLWYKSTYQGPAMIHGDMILMDPNACNVLTGAARMLDDPLTGEKTEWKWKRTYGCNTPAASEHLMMFRSGAAGYYDLCNDGGTGNLGGFRSSCTNNLIVAGGVLTVPDYTRTCTCSYQLQTSAAFVPMPDAEMWTFFTSRLVKGVVKQAGVNFGAPGNRKADNGTLWLEYPWVETLPSPHIEVTTTPALPETFRRHASQASGDGPAWVTASGARGLENLTIRLGPDDSKPRLYTVRLYFAEPDQLEVGDRRFDVTLQDKTVLTGFDILAEAKAPLRGVVKEYKGVNVADLLTLKLSVSEGSRIKSTILCGVEVVAEGR